MNVDVYGLVFGNLHFFGVHRARPGFEGVVYDISGYGFAVFLCVFHVRLLELGVYIQVFVVFLKKIIKVIGGAEPFPAKTEGAGVLFAARITELDGNYWYKIKKIIW